MRKRLKELRKEEFCDEYSEREREGDLSIGRTLSVISFYLFFLLFTTNRTNQVDFGRFSWREKKD